MSYFSTLLTVAAVGIINNDFTADIGFGYMAVKAFSLALGAGVFIGRRSFERMKTVARILQIAVNRENAQITISEENGSSSDNQSEARATVHQS